MTLSSFKKNSKFPILITFIVAYGAISYFLGRVDFLKNLQFDSIPKTKGEATQSNLNKPIDSPVPFADSQSTSIISSYIKRCSNTKLGFEVSYPKDWFTTYNTEDQRCTYFAPYSFTVPQDTSSFAVSVKIEIYNPEDFTGAQNFYENPNDFQNIISDQNVEINGKAVQKIKATTTGSGLIPKGLAIISFVYPDPELPMVLTYQQQGTQEDSAQMEKILEDVVRSVTYF